MDGTSPVDIDALADTTPRECRFIYAETATFGPDVEEFHKTTFQDPPDGALISRAPRRTGTPTPHTGRSKRWSARSGIARTARGQQYVGDWKADAGSLHLRPGGCGRDYRLRSVAIVEVTFCGFAQSVSDIVMTNIVANVPA